MSTALVPGSLQAIATQEGQTLAESFLGADAIIVVDVSGSMAARDVDRHNLERRSGRSRYEAACDELARLQSSLPGKIAVIAFSDTYEFAPSGTPHFIGGGTDLADALRFVHVADGCGMRFIVISDGEPNDESRALAEARRFVDRIDTVYVGPSGDAGERFLQDLARASGGTSSRQSVADLSRTVQQLLLTAG